MDAVGNKAIRNEHGQRVSRVTGKRLLSKRTLHARILRLRARLKQLEAQLREHMEVV